MLLYFKFAYIYVYLFIFSQLKQNKIMLSIRINRIISFPVQKKKSAFLNNNCYGIKQS